MDIKTVIWIAVAIYLAIMLYVGYRASKKASKSFSEYAIAGKNLGFILVGITFLASAWGAGDFIGSPDQGYHVGLSWLPFIVGSEGGKLLFAFGVAAFAGKYAFKTLGEFLSELVTNDRIARVMVGLLTIMASVAWLGGQYLAVGAIFSIFTGADPTLIMIVTALVMILYTSVGGLWSVVWTDLLQGILIIVTSAYYYFAVFGKINFSLGALRESVVALDPSLWSFGGQGIPWLTILTLFFTGFFGLFAQNMFWQRCFAARTPKIARNGFILMGVGALLVSTLSLLVGLIAVTLVPDLGSGVAISLVKELLPQGLWVVVTLLVVAATMSTADSHLNSIAVVTTNDIIRPFRPNWDDKKLLRTCMWATVLWGLISLIGALTFTYIFDLVAWGYTAAGGAIFPFVVIGLLWRKRGAKDFTFKSSRVTPMAARWALIIGSIVSMVFHAIPAVKTAVGGGVIPGALVTAVLLVVISLATEKSEAAKPGATASSAAD